MLRKTLDTSYNSQKTLFTFARSGTTSDSSNFIANYVEIPSGTYFASYGLAEPSDILYTNTRVFTIINIINNTTIHFSFRFGLTLKNPIDISAYADQRVSFKINLTNIFNSLKSQITQYYDVSDDIWTSNIYKTVSSTYPSSAGEFLFKNRTTSSVPDSPIEAFDVTIDGNGISISSGDIGVFRLFKVTDTVMTNNHYVYGILQLNLSVVLSWSSPKFKVKKNLNFLSVKHLLNNLNYKEVA